MIGLVFTVLSIASGWHHLVSLQSLVIDSSHYVTWSDTSIACYDSNGTIVSSSRWPESKPGRLVREHGRIIIQREGANPWELIFETLPSPRIFFETPQPVGLHLASDGRTLIPNSANRASASYPIDPPEALLSKIIDHPPGSVSIPFYRNNFTVVNIEQPVNDRDNSNGPFSALYTFLVTDHRAVRLNTPMKYAQATYCDGRYLLGYTTDDEEMLWHHFGRNVTASPFVCDLSDMNVRLLKKVERIKVPSKYAWDDSMGPNLDGSVRLYPQTINEDGKLVLCNRVQEGPDKRYESVVLFRNGQAEVIENVVVDGVLIRPIRVKDARGSLAILEGKTKSGAVVSFVYGLR